MLTWAFSTGRSPQVRIVVYCEAHHRALVRRVLPHAAVATGEWLRFARAAAGADCAAAVIEDLGGKPGAAELIGLRLRHPWTGIVVVTKRDTENALLGPNAADAVVWLDSAAAALANAVLQAARGLRIRLGRDIAASGLSAWLTNAMLALLEAEPPPQDVDGWAALPRVSCVPRTLRAHFEAELPRGVTPKAFVGVVLAFFALDRSPNARSWSALANAADSDPERVKRTAAWLMGQAVKKPTELPRSRLLAQAARRFRAG